MPSKVLSISICDRCNFNCLYCWSHSPYLIKDYQGYMFDTGRFIAIINDGKRLKVDQVILSGEGEPLLHPEISRMLRYVKDKGMSLVLTTNLSTDISRHKELYEVDRIIINLSAASNSGFMEIHRPSGDTGLKNILANIKYLIKHRGDHKNPQVELRYIINKKNSQDLEAFLSIAGKIGPDRVSFRFMQTKEETKAISIPLDERRILLKRVISASSCCKVDNNLKDLYYAYFNMSLINKTRKCFIGFHSIYLSNTGNVFLCPANSKTFVGNISDDNIVSLVGSNRANWVRIKCAKFFRKDIFSDVCQYCLSHQKITDLRMFKYCHSF